MVPDVSDEPVLFIFKILESVEKKIVNDDLEKISDEVKW